MTYGHVIDLQREFIYQVFEGALSAEQLIACTRRLWADPHYSPLFHGIVDITRLTPRAGLADLMALIEFLKNEPSTSRGRWAVITATPITAAAAMIYQRRMVKRHSFEVFSTWDSACDYLHLEMPAPPEITVCFELDDTAPANA